jgi:hypothetical protein
MTNGMAFPIAEGTLQMHVADFSFLPKKLPVVGAEFGQEVKNFLDNRVDVGAGDGLSPFQGYVVDLSKLTGSADSPLKNATAFLMAFSLESANTGDQVRGVSVCGGN